MRSYVALLILGACSSSASPQWQSALHVPVAAAVVPARTCVASNPKGVTVKGHVVDDAGDPVPGARVIVLQSSTQQQSTTTSKDGAFVFCDLVPLPLESHDLILMAEARNGWRSTSQVMRLENATIQLTLGRTGAVELRVSGAVPEHSIVIGVSSDGEMFRAAVAANGFARAEHVLPGTYALTLRFTPPPGHPPTLGSVTVRPDRVASASLVAQPPNIDIEVRLGSACSTVELRPLSGRPVASLSCRYSVVEFDDQPAGSYDLCVAGQCRRIEVSETHNIFELP